MIWSFVFEGTFLFFAVFVWRLFEDKDPIGYLLGVFVLSSLSIFVFCFGVGFGSLVGLVVPKRWTGPETLKLKPVSPRGKIFLSTGCIGTTPCYFFLMKEGGPTEVVRTDRAKVFEEERRGGELRVYTRLFKNRALKWLAKEWKTYRYEFAVPRGSIDK